VQADLNFDYALPGVTHQLSPPAIELLRVPAHVFTGIGCRADRGSRFRGSGWRTLGPAKVSSVAEAVAMDRSATSRLTARLVDSGMIEARPDPSDGRGVVLNLTDRGRKKVSRALVRKGDVFRQRIDAWSDAELELLAGLLRRFNILPQTPGASASREPSG
jgi:DNA-binding MarR family transcriptional regulator